MPRRPGRPRTNLARKILAEMLDGFLFQHEFDRRPDEKPRLCGTICPSQIYEALKDMAHINRRPKLKVVDVAVALLST
jgi:hypothetical protein